MFAHFFGSKAKGWTLIITKSPGLSEIVSEHKVSGKAEARRLALQFGFTPWNF